MATIPTILKGDDSGTITLNIASGKTYTGATLVVAYQGVTRTYTDLTAGGTVGLSFTHDETAKMLPACKPVLMRLVGSTGAEETVENAEARIKVTECLSEVNAGGSFSVEPSGVDVPVTELGDVGANYTIAQLQEKINQIVRTLAQRSLLALAAVLLPFCMPAAITVQTCPVSNLWSSAAVVTNVSGAATDPQVVTNIVSGYVADATNATLTAANDYTDASIQSAGSVTPTIVTNIVKDVVTNDVNAIVSSATVTNAGAVAAAQAMTNELLSVEDFDNWRYGERSRFYGIAERALSVDVADAAAGISTGLTGVYLQYRTNGMYWELGTGLEEGSSDLFSLCFPTNETGWVATQAYADAAVAGVTATSIGAYPAASGQQLATSVSAISAHLNAEDAHFVSTNYDSTVRTPEAYVEVKIDGSWLTIWKEMTRWNEFTGTNFNWDAWTDFHTWGTNVTTQISDLSSTKADRCWGAYDSETGGYSPEGFTQISSSNIMIAANMAYQRTVTTGGAVWVLQCNSGHATLNGDTNGFFRVSDSDGNIQFEIVQGDAQELGADANGITVDNTTTPPTLTITYSIVASEHPTIKVCNDLTTVNWKSETDSACLANVTWSGTSGAYVATVQPKAAQSKLFVTATYWAGGETYINNRAPVSMSSIYLNGTKYYLGTATIDGHTVLTLSTTAPASN